MLDYALLQLHKQYGNPKKDTKDGDEAAHLRELPRREQAVPGLHTSGGSRGSGHVEDIDMLEEGASTVGGNAYIAVAPQGGNEIQAKEPLSTTGQPTDTFFVTQKFFIQTGLVAIVQFIRDTWDLDGDFYFYSEVSPLLLLTCIFLTIGFLSRTQYTALLVPSLQFQPSFPAY